MERHDVRRRREGRLGAAVPVLAGQRRVLDAAAGPPRPLARRPVPRPAADRLGAAHHAAGQPGRGGGAGPRGDAMPRSRTRLSHLGDPGTAQGTAADRLCCRRASRAGLRPAPDLVDELARPPARASRPQRRPDAVARRSGSARNVRDARRRRTRLHRPAFAGRTIPRAHENPAIDRVDLHPRPGPRGFARRRDRQRHRSHRAPELDHLRDPAGHLRHRAGRASRQPVARCRQHRRRTRRLSARSHPALRARADTVGTAGPPSLARPPAAGSARGSAAGQRPRYSRSRAFSAAVSAPDWRSPSENCSAPRSWPCRRRTTWSPFCGAADWA